jgi:hypothetical protein
VPENIYVPGPGYRQSLSVWAEADTVRLARVGAPVLLHASKHAGPWVQAPSATANLEE